jgi:organic radical activating enzyme
VLESKSCGLKGVQKVFYLSQNRVSSCCRAEPEILDDSRSLTSYLQQWKTESLQLDKGIKLPGCKHCWTQEDNNKISYRLYTNDKFNSLELSLSNLCNQMCSYCSPKFSSTWQESIDQFGTFQNISMTSKINLELAQPSDPNIGYWLDQIADYIAGCADHSVIVKLLGGEPLMQQRNLEKLLSFASQKIYQLSIHTNLNPPTDKFLKWLLKNLNSTRFDFTVSLDACPEFNHWPRALFDQKKFLTNLSLLEQHQVPVRFAAVVSVLSVFDLENFIMWTSNKKTDILFQKLYNPSCLDPTLIPQIFRQQIWEKVKHLDNYDIVKEILQQDDKLDNLRLFEQFNYLTQYFQRNQLDPNKSSNRLFVEYWQWLTKNYKNKYNIE